MTSSDMYMRLASAYQQTELLPALQQSLRANLWEEGMRELRVCNSLTPSHSPHHHHLFTHVGLWVCLTMSAVLTLRGIRVRPRLRISAAAAAAWELY